MESIYETTRGVRPAAQGHRDRSWPQAGPKSEPIPPKPDRRDRHPNRQRQTPRRLGLRAPTFVPRSLRGEIPATPPLPVQPAAVAHHRMLTHALRGGRIRSAYCPRLPPGNRPTLIYFTYPERESCSMGISEQQRQKKLQQKKRRGRRFTLQVAISSTRLPRTQSSPFMNAWCQKGYLRTGWALSSGRGVPRRIPSRYQLLSSMSSVLV